MRPLFLTTTAPARVRYMEMNSNRALFALNVKKKKQASSIRSYCNCNSFFCVPRLDWGVQELTCTRRYSRHRKQRTYVLARKQSLSRSTTTEGQSQSDHDTVHR